MKVEGKVTGSVRLERFVKERRATKNLEDKEIYDLFLDTQFDEYQRWWGKLDYEGTTYEVNAFFKKGDGLDHLPENRVWSTGARLSPWQLEIRLPLSRKKIGEYLEKEGEDPTSARVRQD